ncbi:hypothetical protein X798_07121 [Onchocerca flexuosa]|uniref:Uncharacterized protein n=1 Tax=Onchocerca flexuosa TaxID=387005 RepID=A0A238BKH2_9BILA|nr:hypothetical protein X798_07121 [Onchocerca flexuosa]
MNLQNTMIMQVKNEETEEKRIDESNLSMQAESFSAAAELQTTEQMRKKANGDESTVETAAKKMLMKQIKNEMQTFGRSNNIHKECNPEQDGSETKIAVQLYFDKIDEKSVRLNNTNNFNNKSGKDQKLEKQSDKTISDERNCEEISDERYGKEVHNSRNGRASSSAKQKGCELKLLKLNQRYGYRTFSTFKLSEQELLQREALYIYNGATFHCFDEFEKYFEAYKIVGNNPYRVASSEVLRDGEGKVIERFKYKYIVFHCAHYGNPRKRGHVNFFLFS